MINYLREQRFFNFSNLQVSMLLFESYEVDNMDKLDVRALLFQAGYLTIKNVSRHQLFTLGYPNKEVEAAMHGHFLAAK